jgi:hypothetical protein
VLLVVASALWWHRWIPAVLVAVFVSWVMLHRRLESDRGEALARMWRRVWPPGTAALILLVAGGTVVYWASGEPITPKVLPIALNMLALSIISLGDWWTRPAGARSFRMVAGPPDCDLPPGGSSGPAGHTRAPWASRA